MPQGVSIPAPSLPVVDTTAIVKGSVTPTKFVRIEADSLAAPGTAVLTVPESMTLAGRDVANDFTQPQTFRSGNSYILLDPTGIEAGETVFSIRNDPLEENVFYVGGDGSVASAIGFYGPFIGTGQGVTDINASNIATGTLANARLDPTLTAWGNLTFAANTLGYGTGADAFATTPLTAAGRALIDDADATAQRTTLGLGSLATQSGTFSGTSSGTNTGDQTNISGNAATVTTNANLTGPVTSVGNATTIAAGVVTLAMQADLAQDQFIGRTTASTGVPQTATITAAARTVLDDTTTGAMLTTLGLTAAAKTLIALAATTGNVIYASGTDTWSQGTPDTAGLVAKSGTQTGIAGDKTWTGDNNYTGALTSGTTTAGAHVGLVSSVPTVQLANGTASQNVRLDNSSGTFRVICNASVPVTATPTAVALAATTVTTSIAVSGAGSDSAGNAPFMQIGTGVGKSLLWQTSAGGHGDCYVLNASSVWNRVMRITQDTNRVLIGTTTDDGTNRLQVSGSGVFSGALTAASINLGGATVLDVLSATATLDFGSTAAGASAELTITVTGASVGDAVFISTPATGDANTCYTARVSAADTVTIKFNNYGLLSAVDPASGTYRAVVIKI